MFRFLRKLWRTTLGHQACGVFCILAAMVAGDASGAVGRLLDVQPNRWHQIALPCAPGGGRDTVAALFGSALPGEYGSTWVLYGYRPGTGYFRLALDDALQQGVGYWFVFLDASGNGATLDLSASCGDTPVSAMAGCPAGRQCYSTPLATAPGRGQWNMPGFPFDRPLDWAALRVVGDAACSGGCSPTEAEAANVFHHQGWRYDPAAESYVELAGGALQPWAGFWAATLSQADGGAPRLLFPQPAPSWWRPSPGTSWQWQLSGAIDTSLDVAMYDIDLVETPQAVIDQLHADGRKVICYYSAGSWENYRDDADQFPAAVLGKTLDGWPDEKWLDIRRFDVLAPIMRARLDTAVAKGCDGVEPDNVDAYANDTGFPLTREDQLAYNRWTASEAHARGLSVGLKNALGLIPHLVADYDWALNEQCFQYDECNLLTPFVDAGKAVFGVEYQGNASSFCPRANALNFDWLKKRLALDAWRQSCRKRAMRKFLYHLQAE